MRKLFSILILLTFFQNSLVAQSPKKLNSSEIYEAIKKLNFLGSVLYVAAHPDDENTHLISYFANEVKAQTAYISLTRGDGGQNLIGPELKELLGVIRTQELLQARKVDGGIQFFSRAIDFGYSKTPDETLKIWNKEEVLSDLVYVIRKFQPDIIINRFDHRSPGTTHGHHTASAMLSLEAFEAAADKKRFQNQLNKVKIWQPKRLFFNPSWFFYGSQDAFDRADKSNYFSMDIGTYYSTLGLSNSEIAAKSRSQHSSQGFGAVAVRGSSLEYLEPIFGGMPNENVFEGIDTSWNRVKNGKPIGKLIDEIIQTYDFKNPSLSIPDLLQVYDLINALEDSHWKKVKLEEVKELILSCAGLYLEAVASTETAVRGEQIDIAIEATNRSEAAFVLKSVMNQTFNQTLKYNQNYSTNIGFTIPESATLTSPYWLNENPGLGMYDVDDLDLIGLAETPDAVTVDFQLEIDGRTLSIERPLVYKFNDPAVGESYKPFAIVPKVSTDIAEKVIIFNDEKSKLIAVKVKGYEDDMAMGLSLKAPKDWKVSPEIKNISLSKKGEEKTYWFEVYPPKNQSEGELKAVVKYENEIYDKTLVEINYRHIPEQKVLLSAASKIVKIDIQKDGDKIAYIDGAGDALPESLRQIGYEVTTLNPREITWSKLKEFDAVVLGIRAFNVVPELAYKNKILFEYVKEGGNVLVQYNTNHALVTEEISPLPLKLSRIRVTEEDAKVNFINPTHSALNYPNKITEKDFEGWIQERGLYFPKEWDLTFESLFSMADTGEEQVEGSVLILPYGKGNYVYTGLSFFRELPAAVPGAYRLIANLLSLKTKE